MIFKQKIAENFNESKINNISREFNLNKDIVKLLFLRNIDTKEKIEKFLNPAITDLYNPFLLKNMRQAVDIINKYVKDKKKIVILGDYDTDGISAASILYKYFESVGIKTEVFLPNRVIDGYGLTTETIDKLNSLYSPDLIITVDCGITCVEEVAYCKRLGIEIVVTDHHDIPEELPDCCIVDPKMEDQLYPFKELCGAGVALKLVQALAGVAEALKYITIASIATVADIVPLVDENRVIVYYGLKYQKEQLPVGLQELMKVLKVPTPLVSSDISFKLAPKINAAGRIGDAKISFNLYVEKDKVKINENIEKLFELNDIRVEETNKIFLSACEMLEDVNVARLGMIILFNKDWESGVLGIICSKLVEKYNKPVCLLTMIDGEYKGSLRSIPGVNIHDALTSVKDLLTRFGGHNQAGGLTIPPKNLKEFRTRINKYVLENTNESDLINIKYYDLNLDINNVTIDFVKDLDKLEPFGFKNEKPCFRIPYNNAVTSRMANYPQHIKMAINDINIIGFNKGDYYYNLVANTNKELLIELNVEKYGKKERINAFIKHINYGKLNTATKSEIIRANYLEQLRHLPTKCQDEFTIKYMDKEALFKKISYHLNKSLLGTVIIVNHIETYFDVVKKFGSLITNFEMFNLLNANGENAVIFAPNYDVVYKDYQNIFVLDYPVCNGYLYSMATKYNTIYTNNTTFNFDMASDISVDRDRFSYILSAVHNFKKEKMFPDLISYFSALKRVSGKQFTVKYNEFVFFTMVLEELGLIEHFNGNIVFTNAPKNELTNSSIYNYVSLLLDSNKE